MWWYHQGALQYGPHRLLVLQDERLLPSGPPLPVDIVLLSNGVDIQLEQLLEKVDFHLALIDGSNPPWKARAWLEQAGNLGIECHYTAEDGAWVQDW